MAELAEIEQAAPNEMEEQQVLSMAQAPHACITGSFQNHFRFVLSGLHGVAGCVGWWLGGLARAFGQTRRLTGWVGYVDVLLSPSRGPARLTRAWPVDRTWFQ